MMNMRPQGTTPPPEPQPTPTPGQPIPIDIGPVPGVAGGSEPVQPRRISPTPEEYAGIIASEPGALAPFPGAQAGPRAPITSYIYSGSNLVDSGGRIARKPYDPLRESMAVLAELPAAERMARQQEMARRGFYPRGMRPSQSGFEPHDLKAMEELLTTANYWGYTVDAAWPLVLANYEATGSGRAVRPTAEIRKSLDAQAVEALGRKFTDAEVQGLISQIRQREAGGDQTSATTMAEQVVAGANPDEQQAFRFVQVANILNDMLRGG